MSRPDWDDYFLGIAKIIARRSHDIHTQHGCVIVDDNKHIVATGYNGFPRGMPDDRLPTERPEKYKWMKHSEKNAVANANGPVRGCTAYVTGPPCFACLTDLWGFGVETIVHIAGYGWQMDSAEKEDRERFIADTGITIREVKPDLGWLIDVVLNDKHLTDLLVRRGWTEVIVEKRPPKNITIVGKLLNNQGDCTDKQVAYIPSHMLEEPRRCIPQSERSHNEQEKQISCGPFGDSTVAPYGYESVSTSLKRMWPEDDCPSGTKPIVKQSVNVCSYKDSTFEKSLRETFPNGKFGSGDATEDWSSPEWPFGNDIVVTEDGTGSAPITFLERETPKRFSIVNLVTGFLGRITRGIV